MADTVNEDTFEDPGPVPGAEPEDVQQQWAQDDEEHRAQVAAALRSIADGIDQGDILEVDMRLDVQTAFRKAGERRLEAIPTGAYSLFVLWRSTAVTRQAIAAFGEPPEVAHIALPGRDFPIGGPRPHLPRE